jgi:hypothetical protein
MLRTRRYVLAGTVAAVSLGVSASTSLAASTGGTVVGLWHMDEQQGAAVMVDASGQGHDGVIDRVTTGLAGYEGQAYGFHGDGLVRVPDSDDLDPGAAPMVISVWLRVPATLSTGDYNVLQKGTATAQGGAYKLEIFAQKASSPMFGHPDCAFNGLHGHNRVYGPRSVADGSWHRVECHLTPTQAYVTVDGQSGQVQARQVDTIANTTDLTVGGKPTNTHYFEGLLDEASVTIG